MKSMLSAVALLLFIGVRLSAQTPAPTVDQILDKYVEAIG
jgi:hypothetical protein